MTNRLAEVYAPGQSPWCDNVARDQINAGVFQRMIAQDSIVSVTSKPSIFQKAMTTGQAYDEQFRALAEQQLDALSTYQIMANQDIHDVLTLFRLIYDRTHGIDGYVSLEVSPLLAHEKEQAIVEAKQLWTHLNQPNLFIKIPGIAERINVNVTLIFSLATYEQVILAYLCGLEQLATCGTKPLNQVASVASFFVSRVDRLVDRLLDEKIEATTDTRQRQLLHALHGRAAIANARLAYQLYTSYFVRGPRAQRFQAACQSSKAPAEQPCSERYMYRISCRR